MKTRRFVVKAKPEGAQYPHWFYLYVYPTAEELRHAAGRYRSNVSDGFREGAVACYQPAFSCCVDRTGAMLHTRNSSFIGVMRLNLEHFQPHVVIHESVHAAVALASSDRLLADTVDADDIEIQELIAHATDEISLQLLKMFRMVY